MSELKPCPFCEGSLDPVIETFRACNSCHASFYDVSDELWDQRPNTSAIESAVLRRVASNSRLPHGGDRLYTAADLIAEADRIDKEQQ